MTDRYTLREPVRALQYDGKFGGARHLAIEAMLAQAFGRFPGDRRAYLASGGVDNVFHPVVYTSADWGSTRAEHVSADDYVVIHYIDGKAAAVSVLSEAVFDAMYVAVG